MTMLFGAMLAALTTVYDKESGVMRMMIVAPLPHAWIVIAKMVSAAARRDGAGGAADRAARGARLPGRGTELVAARGRPPR